MVLNGGVPTAQHEQDLEHVLHHQTSTGAVAELGPTP